MDPALQELFTDPLRDLGEDDPRLAGIFIPEPERGAPRSGVTAQFLENAAEYHKRYDNVAWFRELLGGALGADDGTVRVILDVGSGSGNSVIPLLDLYPRAFVVATDISPSLLAILRDFLEARPQYRARCGLVCMDANNDRFRPRAFDLAVGAAILHHILDPARVLHACASALRPGARALFLEPFETGHGVLRIAYRRILAEAARRREKGPGFDMLRRMVADHEARLRDRSDPLVAKLDDKWFFTRAWFEKAAGGPEWTDLRIEGIGGDRTPMTDLARSELRLGIGADETALPGWAWDIVREHENAFSREGRRDLLFEAVVTMRRSALPLAPAAGRRPGWWWNPAQSGRGFFVEPEGPAPRAACCLYGDDGEPAWSVADASRLDLSAGPETLAIELGGATARLEPQHGEFARDARTGWWIERSPSPASCVVAECLGERAMAALLAPDGWSLVVAARRADGSYHGEWLRFRGGQTATGPYRAPQPPERLGPASLAWSADDALAVLLPGGRRAAYRRLGPAEAAPQNFRSTEKCAS
ncbi:MAG TPA: class I SAM-dependent methyltransferase [Usitatibacter sp.]|nr:class I SAM-dependent methyltransferase [Usitatibacter sp.]